jgi:hypothetical protein
MEREVSIPQNVAERDQAFQEMMELLRRSQTDESVCLFLFVGEMEREEDGTAIAMDCPAFIRISGSIQDGIGFWSALELEMVTARAEWSAEAIIEGFGGGDE